MTHFVLMTAHAKFLGTDGHDKIVLSGLGEADFIPAVIEMETESDSLDTLFIFPTHDTISVNTPSGFSGDIVGEYNIGRRSISYRRGDRYVSVLPPNEQGDVALAYDRAEPGGWESFLPLNDDAVKAIQFLQSNDWVVGSSKILVKKENIEILENFVLCIGDLKLDLRYQRFEYNERSKSMIMFVDGWKYEKIYLYKPLVYYTAFKSEHVMQQFYLSIRSLRLFGAYDGDVLAFTDKTLQELEEKGGDPCQHNLDIYSVYPKDFVGYVAAKYDIIKIENARQYQPVLYLDPDIIIDRPIEQVLVDIVASGAVCAPIEDFSPVATSVSVGKTLTELAGIHVGYRHGFNGGTIGINNIAVQEEFLKTTRQIITNTGIVLGRNFNRWVDQEVVNYTGIVMDSVRTDVISKYVRYGYRDGSEYDIMGRTGLIHFFGRTIEGKVDAMRIYFDRLVLNR